MADATDLYSRWLGIPLAEQPPNYYRLLGVGLFEADRGVIDAAAKRLMAQLQRSASGEDTQPVRRLLTEIANARVCLLTPQKRTTYDAGLQAELNSAEQDSQANSQPASPSSDEALDNAGWSDDGGSVAAAIPLDEEPVTPAPQPTATAQPTAAAKPTAAPKTPAPSPSRKAPDAAKPSKPPVPAAVESEFGGGAAQGSFFADLGLGSGIGASGNSPAAASRTSASAGAKVATKGAAKVTSAGGAKGSIKSVSKPGGNLSAQSKGPAAGGGSTLKIGPWKLQSWHIPAMVGGGFVLLVVAALIVSSIGGFGSSDPHPAAKAGPSGPSTPRFGPGSFTGTIDDITTHSPLGLRSAAQVPLERQGDLLLVDVKINGQEAGKFLLDTGTYDVILSTKVADRLKLPELRRATFQGPGGKQSASERKIKSLGIGTVEFEDKTILPPRPKDDWTALAIDMKPWEDALKLPIAGVIGSDVLYQMPVSINAQKKSLTFFNRHKFTLSDNQHPEFLSLIDNSKKPCVPAGVNHTPVNDRQMFLLATGAPTGVMLSEPEGKIDSLSLFGQDFADPASERLTSDNVYFTGDSRQFGVIGSQILANFELLLDFQNNKVLASHLAPK